MTAPASLNETMAPVCASLFMPAEREVLVTVFTWAGALSGRYSRNILYACGDLMFSRHVSIRSCVKASRGYAQVRNTQS